MAKAHDAEPQEPGDTNPSDRERVAADARARAKAAGATGRAKSRLGDTSALTRQQRVLRDVAIMASIHAGMSAKDVAKEFGITPRSVERIAAAFRLAPTALDQQPMEIVERLLRTYEQQMMQFAAMAEANQDRNPNVAISAAKAGAESLERYINLMADVGKLPDNLELFRAESELMRLGDLILAKLRALEAGEVSPADVARFVREAVLSPAGLPVIEAKARDNDVT